MNKTIILMCLIACTSESDVCADTGSPEARSVEIISDRDASGLPILHLEESNYGGVRGRLQLRFTGDWSVFGIGLEINDTEDIPAAFFNVRPDPVYEIAFQTDGSFDSLDGIGHALFSYQEDLMNPVIATPIRFEYHADPYDD